jgi:hypothetical protein
MAFPVVTIENAHDRAKPYKLADSNGLYLLIGPSGRMNYCHLGKQKTLAFGTWPDAGLADIRA